MSFLYMSGWGKLVSLFLHCITDTNQTQKHATKHYHEQKSICFFSLHSFFSKKHGSNVDFIVKMTAYATVVLSLPIVHYILIFPFHTSCNSFNSVFLMFFNVSLTTFPPNLKLLR